MKKLFALLLVLVMMVSLVACAQNTTDPTKGTEGNKESTLQTRPSEETVPSTQAGEDISARYGGVFYLNWGPGDTYDPMKTSGWKSYCWSQNVYENLIYRDAEGNLAPGVCDFELSEDALTLKLWVRDGVKFHDGSLVDIYDVKASFERANSMISRNKNHIVPYLESAEVTEDKYLTIKFNAYDPTTLYYLSSTQVWTVVLPKEICEKYGKEPIINIEDAIGTGPYYVDKGSEPGVKMVLTRFEDHCKVAEGHSGLASPKMAYFDQIIVDAYEDDQVALMDMITAEKNLRMSYDPQMKEMFDQVPGLKLYPDNDRNLQYIAFNCKNENVVCKDANVRKAIAACLDYAELMSYMTGGIEYDANVSPMVEGNAYYCEKYAAADYHGAANVELAKSYLQKAGYNGEEIIFAASEGRAQLFAIMDVRFKAAGINVKIEYMDSTTLASYIADTNNNFDFTMVSSVVGEYIPATVAVNVMDTFYDGVDEHLKTNASLVVGSAESIADWKLADAKLAEDCPTVIFGNEYNVIAYNNNIIYDNQGPWRYWYNSYVDPAAK